MCINVFINFGIFFCDIATLHCTESLYSYCRGLYRGNSFIIIVELYTPLQKTPDNDFVIDKHPIYNNIVIGVGFTGICHHKYFV